METGQTDTLIDPVALSALFDVKNRLINTALRLSCCHKNKKLLNIFFLYPNL